MIPYFSKKDLLTSVAQILKADSTITALVPKRNISIGASDFTSMSAAIDVTDGGDELRSEIRWRTSVQVVIKTKMASINDSDLMCCDIESAVSNCLAQNQDLILDGVYAVSRFVESSSEPMQDTEDPNVRSHVITLKYELM